MSSESKNPTIEDIDLDDWSDGELDEETLSAISSLDGRRLVENKLEEIRLLRETSEYDFDF